MSFNTFGHHLIHFYIHLNMNPQQILDLCKKAKWIGDKDIFDIGVMKRELLIHSLNNGEFISDCANWINLITFLSDSETIFRPLPGTIKNDQARYCGPSDLLVSNAVPISCKGQWIIQICGEWWGMTQNGPECHTMDEWLEISRIKMSENSHVYSVIKELTKDPWIAHTCIEVTEIVKKDPTIEQRCEILKIKIEMHSSRRRPNYEYDL